MYSNTRKRMVLWFCYLAYTAIYVARLNLSMASPELKEAGVLTTAQLGMLGSFFSVVYALSRLVNGAMSDRKTPRLMIVTGLLLCSAANMLIGFFPPFIGILLLWCVNAFAQSMLWGSVLCSVVTVYGEEAAKKRVSFLVSSCPAGQIISILLTTVLIDYFGLRWAFIIPGLVTAILGLILLFVLNRIPAPIRETEEMQGEKQKPLSCFSMLRSREFQIVSIPAFFHGILKENITLWMTVFFVDRYAIDLNQTAGFVLLIPIVGLVARMMYPFAYRLCKNREHLVSQFGFLICIPAGLLLCFEQLPPVLAICCLSILYAAISLINTTFLTIYPLRFAREGKTASVSGIMDFVTYLGGGIGSVVYGFIIDRLGYVPMFASWIAFSVISLWILTQLPRLSGRNTDTL